MWEGYFSEHVLTWPIVRVRKVGWFGKKQVVWLRPDAISILTTRKSVTEEMLTSDELGSGEASFIRIPKEKIRAVRVIRIDSITASSWWSRFQVESDQGRHEFRIPDRESPNVLRALHEIAGDRFLDLPLRHSSFCEITLILALAILVGVGCVVAGAFVESIGLIFVIMGLVFLGPVFLALSRGRKLSEYRMPAPPRQRRSAVRRPFRSRDLGNGLKLLGITSLVYLLFSKYHVVASNFIPSMLVTAIGYRLCLRTFEPRQHPDPRKPVLFLRAFDDDGKRTFQPTDLLARFHGIFRYEDVIKDFYNIRTLHGVLLFGLIFHPAKFVKLLLNMETFTTEELLAHAFRRCGPFVAIGRPGEPLVTAGADKMYVPDSDWQEVVLEYLNLSQAVILQPGLSEGIRWEIEQVFARVPRYRVMLSMLYFKDRPNEYEKFRGWLAQELGIRLSLSLPFQENPTLVYFEADRSVRYQPICYRSSLVWTFFGNAVDTDRTFHTFIQGLRGTPRSQPRHPKRHTGHSVLSGLIVVPLFFLVISYETILQVLRYHARVANAVAQEKVRTVIPIGGPESNQFTTYRSEAIFFEFTLNSDWKPVPIPSEDANKEHSFEYRDGLGKLVVRVKAGERLSDLSSPTFTSEVRDAVEEDVRIENPTAVVKVIGSRWVTVNDVQWRQVMLEERYGWTLRKMRRVLYYSGPKGWIVVTITLPENDHYMVATDQLISTFRANPTRTD